MKKVLSIVVVLSLVFVFTACGSGSGEENLAINAIKEFKDLFKDPSGVVVASDVKLLNLMVKETKTRRESVLAFNCEITYDGSTASGRILMIVDGDGHLGDWTSAETVSDCKSMSDVVLLSYYNDGIEHIDKYGSNQDNYPESDEYYWTLSTVKREVINKGIH